MFMAEWHVYLDAYCWPDSTHVIEQQDYVKFVKAIELPIAKCSVSQCDTGPAYAGNITLQCNDLQHL